jgi:hypothetical protein
LPRRQYHTAVAVNERLDLDRASRGCGYSSLAWAIRELGVFVTGPEHTHQPRPKSRGASNRWILPHGCDKHCRNGSSYPVHARATLETSDKTLDRHPYVTENKSTPQDNSSRAKILQILSITVSPGSLQTESDTAGGAGVFSTIHASALGQTGGGH